MQILKKSNNNDENDKNIWSTKHVNTALNGIEEGYELKISPFYERDINYRKGELLFEYTDEEISEIKKCAKDVIYFANNYAYTMTDHGMKQIILRDYQEDILKRYQSNKEVVFMASRQIGKCHFFDSQVVVKNTRNDVVQNIEIYKLYKPQTFLERLKHFLYKLYCIFD